MKAGIRHVVITFCCGLTCSAIQHTTWTAEAQTVTTLFAIFLCSALAFAVCEADQ